MKCNIKRIKHISHGDLDGFSCTILTELLVEAQQDDTIELELAYTSPYGLHGVVKKTLNEISRYDLVIITDLAMSQETVDAIQNSGYSDKFLVFDHHETNVDTSKYNWLTIQPTWGLSDVNSSNKSTCKTCGAGLYINFLISTTLFDFNILQTASANKLYFFISCVTSWDTRTYNKTEDPIINTYFKYYWDSVKQTATRLNTLFHILDRAEFISYIKDFITNDDFGIVERPPVIRKTYSWKTDIWDESQDTVHEKLTHSTFYYPWVSKLIDTEERRNKKYVEHIVKQVNIISLKKDIFKNTKIHPINFTIGLAFAEHNLADIGELACLTYPEIDLCAIIWHNTVNLYTTRDDVDVGAFAMLLGGGGHPKASGFTIELNDSNWFDKNHFMAMFNNAANIEVPVKS